MFGNKRTFVWVTNIGRAELASGEVRFIHGFASEPAATTKYSDATLSGMGMVGIYKRKGDTEFQTISQRPLDRPAHFSHARQSSKPNRA